MTVKVMGLQSFDVVMAVKAYVMGLQRFYGKGPHGYCWLIRVSHLDK
jgi:hypothetical protein